MENVICPPTSEQPHLLPEQAICLLTGAEDEVAEIVIVVVVTAGAEEAEIKETIAVETAETEEGTEARANSATHT